MTEDRKAMEKITELSPQQKEILTPNGWFNRLSEQEILAIAGGMTAIETIGEEELVVFLQVANLLYRGGVPLISDAAYDFTFLDELRRRNPEHPFLHDIEPEPTAGAKTVELPVRMLSTEKAYDFESMKRWAKRIEKGAAELGLAFDSLLFRATPKLDGYAAYDDGTMLYTRGDGRKGTDITRAFERGLQVAGNGERGLGSGEIVVSRSYFAAHLAAHFDNSRNFQASLIKEKELEAPAAEAIKSGEAVFYPFSLLPFWQGHWHEVESSFEEIIDGLWRQLDYDIDGIVFEVTNETLKDHMGATRHHHRWQIAYKRNTETADVKVLQIIPQTSRSGRVSPVAEIEPTRLSGALIKRATAHHYGMVREKGIGPGALIRLSRSGEVIPKIEEVLEGVLPQFPESCPSCGEELLWESDHLICMNHFHCPAQIQNSIGHFFRTLGNIDGFGPSSIAKLFSSGYRRISEIYNLGQEEFVACGFGPKQSENMVDQLNRSLVEPIEDWRFLAAYGVHRMGMGNCEKLLSVYPLDTVFQLKESDITTIKGFSEKIAREMCTGLAAIRQEFTLLSGLGFNIVATPVVDQSSSEGNGVLAGKNVVFTGTMRHGSRDDMKKQAKSLGAKVGSSITGKTDLLVCGEKVGNSKLEKARTLGVEVISEEEYFQRVVGG